jgi:hypothetical protein
MVFGVFGLRTAFGFFAPHAKAVERVALCAALAPGAALTACGTVDSRLAGEARSELIGMSELDLHRCAGPPAKTETIGRSVLQSYEQTETQPSVGVALPSIGALGGGGLNVSGTTAGSCKAIFELVDGKIASVHYAGATASGLGSLALCGPIVEHCLTDGKAAAGGG